MINNKVVNPKDMRISAINDVKINISKPNDEHVVEVQALKSINFDNNQTNMIDYDRNLFSTRVILNLNIEYDNDVQIPLGRLPISSYALNITNIPVNTDKLKPNNISITYDDTSRPQIHFSFNSTLKHTFQSEYKFQLELYVYDSDCLLANKMKTTVGSKAKRFGNVADLLSMPTHLLMTKTFEIKFENNFDFKTILGNVKQVTSEMKTESNGTVLNTTDYPYMVKEATNDNQTELNGNVAEIDDRQSKTADKYSLLKLILYFLLSFFLIVSIVFFMNLILINAKRDKLLGSKNKSIFNSNNTDLSMPTYTKQNNVSKDIKNEHSLSSSTMLIVEHQRRATTPVPSNILKSQKPTLRHNIVKKLRLNTNSLTNEVIANAEFDFVLMTTERRFSNRNYANQSNIANTIDTKRNDDRNYLINTYDNHIPETTMCSLQKESTMLVTDTFRHIPKLRKMSNQKQPGTNRWSTPYNILLLPALEYDEKKNETINFCEKKEKKRASLIYEEMSSYFETLKESCA
jgi:hypothetical protein